MIACQNLQTIELNTEYSELKNLSMIVNCFSHAQNCKTHSTSLREEIELLLSFWRSTVFNNDSKSSNGRKRLCWPPKNNIIVSYEVNEDHKGCLTAIYS